jgi:HAE1 family hydrophobic/amphiphilic exporter-1
LNIAEPFIRRPVMTTLVSTGILIFGAIAYRLLPVSDLPTVDYPTVSVSAGLPGASPETMASAVATPLEKQFSTIPGLDVMTSSSGLGSTSITLQFALDRDIDAAAQDVQAAISQTLRQLPQGMLPPSYRKVDPSASPIMYYVLRSATMPLSQVNQYGEGFIAQRLSTVEGVAQVQVYGSQKYAVRIQLDPQKLQAWKVGIDEVADAVNTGNVNQPSGVLWGSEQAYTVQSNGQLENAAAFRSLVVTWRNGAPVRLQDLGTVSDGVQNTKTASWFTGTRAIVLAIQRQPGSNTVAVAGRVRTLMQNIHEELPAALSVTTMFDRSLGIEESVTDVKFTLLLTIVLVVLVIFLFLRNLSATLIPSLALPMSLVGTFAVMYLLGFSLDNLSLMALTLAVGFVVDDAIVVLENIVRHTEMGEKPFDAALNGAREIGFTIVSMTVSLVAVFIPLLLLQGLIGRLFREFAVTIAVAILVSMFVSLTLTPMLCARWLRPGQQQRQGRFYDATERAWQRVLGAYKRSLGWVMAHRPLTLVFSGVILVGTGVLGVLVPKGFIPSEDQERLLGSFLAQQGSSFDAMVRYQQQVSSILGADPNIQDYMISLGSGPRSSGNNEASLFLHLKPRDERSLDADGVARQVIGKLNQIPGGQAFISNPPVINVGGRGSRSLYQFTLQGPDVDELFQAAQGFLEKMKGVRAITDVTSDLQIKNPEVDVTIDRDRASALGLTADAVQSALYNAYGARQVSTIFTQQDQYWVVMELLPEYQRDLNALNMLSIRSPTGDLVPLMSVAEVAPSVGPLSVNHSGQLPAVTLSFNTAPGVSLGSAVTQVQDLARRSLPATINTTFAGTAQAFKDAQSGLLVLLVLAIVVIYLVLGILYESFVHPITILTGLPFAGFGALLILLITRMDLSIYAFVGIILLVGLVKKNAIMMIDFAVEAERKQGKSPTAAIIEACHVRFRPIMMTTMAALMGTLPIAFGAGAGAEPRRPLGVAVVGGLAFSQLVTLYVTPVFYTYFDALAMWLRQRRGAATRMAIGTAPVESPRSPDA